MRDEKEERKKQVRSNKQTRQSNTAHPCMRTVLGSGKSGAGSHDWVAGSCDPRVASQTSHCVVVVWKVRERSSR